MFQRVLVTLGALVCSTAFASFDSVNCSSADGSVRYRYLQRWDMVPHIEWTVKGDVVRELAGGFVSKPVVLEKKNRPEGFEPMVSEKTYFVRVSLSGTTEKNEVVAADVFLICVSHQGK